MFLLNPLLTLFISLSPPPSYASFTYLRRLYHSYAVRWLSGSTRDFLWRVKPKLFAGSRGLGTITLWPNLKGVPSKCCFFFFQSVSGVSTANITQASNSHACDLTPLAANVFSGAELAWFREDGNFNLPSIIFPIITPFTAISESREGVEQLKRRASCTLCPTLI